MKPELRDWFAVQVAATLAAEPRHGLHDIASRAYDLAEALVAERGRRFDAELAAIEDERGDAYEYLAAQGPRGLLDEAMPLEERDDELDPSWFDAPHEHSPWDRDEGPLLHRGGDAGAQGPGLARVQLELPVELRPSKVGS